LLLLPRGVGLVIGIRVFAILGHGLILPHPATARHFPPIQTAPLPENGLTFRVRTLARLSRCAWILRRNRSDLCLD